MQDAIDETWVGIAYDKSLREVDNIGNIFFCGIILDINFLDEDVKLKIF